MKENEIELNAFVYHKEWGVGRIVALEGDGQWVLVDFRGRPKHRMTREIALRSLSRLPDDGLEASLWNSPDTARIWAKKRPLRLVAAALADAGGTAKAKDLQTCIEQHLDTKWNTWWKRIQPLVKQSPYFHMKEGSYVISGNPSDVPEEALPTRVGRRTTAEPKSSRTHKVASSREWIKWLLTDIDSAPPAKSPAPVVFDILDALPAEMLEGINRRLLYGLRFVLEAQPRPSVRILAGWVDAISRLSNRWIQSSSPGFLKALPEQLVRFTADLLDKPRHRTFAGQVLPVLAAIAEKNDQLARGIGDCLVSLLQAGSRGAAELFRGLVDKLPETARRLLSREVIRKVFQTGTPEQQYLALNAVNDRDRGYLLEYLALLMVDGQIPVERVVEAFRGEWLAIQGAVQVTSLRSPLLGAMLLGAAAEPLHLQIEDAFRLAIREKEQSLTDPVIAMLVHTAREEVLHTRRELEQRLHNEVDNYNARLSEAHAEIERMRRNTDDLQQQVARRREEARLEIRRDMLVAIGEVLQIMSVKDRKPANLTADIEAGLSLALRAGGAEVLGCVGEEVPYDSRRHQAERAIDEGTPVVVVAPGVLVRGGQRGELILLKARTTTKDQGTK